MSSDSRSNLIKQISAWLNNKYKENIESRTAPDRYLQLYCWFRLITRADPSCALAKNALEDILKQYPEIEDFVESKSFEDQSPQSPSVKKLLSKSPAERVSYFLSFEGDRLTLSRTLAENLQWGIDLAKELERVKDWETDLWKVLIGAWGRREWHFPSEEKQCKAILNYLGRELLWKKYHYDISQVLYSLVQGEDKECVFSILPDVNKLASALWTIAAEDKGYPDTSKDWIESAINCTPGMLAMFWIRSFSHWLEHQDPKPERLPAEYRQELDRILQDQSAAGGIALSVLSKKFSFFLSVDYDWTVESILPWFDFEKDPKRFQQSWHGFLSGSLNQNVFEILSPYFKEALTKIDNELASKRDNLIEFLAISFVFYIPNPLEEWMPLFFKEGNREDRGNWAMSVGRILRACS